MQLTTAKRLLSIVVFTVKYCRNELILMYLCLLLCVPENLSSEMHVNYFDNEMLEKNPFNSNRNPETTKNIKKNALYIQEFQYNYTWTQI